MIRSAFLRFAFFVFLMIILFPLGAQESLTADLWQEDLQYLHQEILDNFPDQVPSQVEHQVAALQKQMPELDRGQMVVGMMEILALLNQESSMIWPFQEGLSYHILPLKTFWFEEGLYIIDALDTALVFQRIVAIEGQQIEEVYQTMKPVISGENQGSRRWNFLRYGLITEMLQARGVIARPDGATLTLALGDSLREVTLTGVDWETFYPLKSRTLRKTSLNSGGKDHTGENLWFEMMPDQPVMYVQINQVRDQENETLEQFMERLGQALDENPVDKLILDHRFGGGGSGHSTGVILEKIAQINPGALYILIGRVTSGTVLELTSMLENTTPAILIGEPTMESPNGVDDPTIITLPNSGIELAITEVTWPTTLAQDPRAHIQPDIKVKYTFKDYRNHVDPALQAALQHQPKEKKSKPVPDDLADALTGRYHLGPRQYLTISRSGENLSFATTDLKRVIGLSFFHAHSPMYYDGNYSFSTDITDVSFTYREENLILDWRGVEKELQPASFWWIYGLGVLVVTVMVFFIGRRRGKKRKLRQN